jgi:hypothetical protein
MDDEKYFVVMTKWNHGPCNLTASGLGVTGYKGITIRSVVQQQYLAEKRHCERRKSATRRRKDFWCYLNLRSPVSSVVRELCNVVNKSKFFSSDPASIRRGAIKLCLNRKVEFGESVNSLGTVNDVAYVRGARSLLLPQSLSSKCRIPGKSLYIQIYRTRCSRTLAEASISLCGFGLEENARPEVKRR